MEELKHECGIALIRLRKPLEYYKQKYGTYLYGVNKLYLLMEKQHNRGQEGAGIGCVNLDALPGDEYVYRERALGSGAISEIFKQAKSTISEALRNGVDEHQLPFVGQLYMGHLRYSTTGKSGISFVHPFLRRNNWRSRCLMLCGNFNMTNVDEVFNQIVEQGQHPRIYSDTVILLEQLGQSLDNHNQELYNRFRSENLDGKALTSAIEDHIDLSDILRKSAPSWDGGYALCGFTGSGNTFVMRDPHGIRPAFYYADEEVFVAASERPVIQAAFDLQTDQVRELKPGAAIILSKDGGISETQILAERENAKCSFERIYFSRGGDADIYAERKSLGRNLVPQILKAINYELDNTIFSFIPNTAEVSYLGLIEGMKQYLVEEQKKSILALNPRDENYEEDLEDILSRTVRTEKIANKDIKLRTFITEGSSRNDLAAHVYDVTYGQVRPKVDNLVVIDDSIVRGTTLKQSILRMLNRLEPKKIVVVSSSPQIRFPDYYGIDMSRMAEFCAFKATISLLHKRGKKDLIDEVYRLCKAQENLPKEEIVNYVPRIYDSFTDEEVSAEIVENITDDSLKSDVEIIFQTIDGLHDAIPNNRGDWYFTGHYPTPGGNKMVNQAFINWYEGNPEKR